MTNQNVAICHNCIFHRSCSLIRGEQNEYRCYQPKTKASDILEFIDNWFKQNVPANNGGTKRLEPSCTDSERTGRHGRRLAGSLKKAKEEKVS